MRERDRERYLQLLEGILDNLPIAAKVKDVNDGMRYTFWNKKAEELFECSAREAIGKTDFETMPDEQRLYKKRRISSVTEYFREVKKEEHVLS